MGAVVLTHVNKVYHGNVHAVRDVNLNIVDKEFVVFVGPSGCGKTTTLRMIAGLEEISSGDIQIDGRVVNDVDPQDRNISMVFQNYALYPHKRVYENLAFGLKLRGIEKSEIDRRVQAAATVLGLSQLLERRPGALSGGQRQRVALGRAIVRQPSVFLFDEPLSNLDARLRHQMRTELAKLHARLQTTMIYVTHDQLEAMTLGDRIVVMKNGEIQQVGTPMEIYDHPRTKFVAAFIGAPEMNFLKGRIADRGGDFYFECEGAGLKLNPEQAGKIRGASLSGREVVFGVRPQDIYDKLFTPAGSDYHKVAGRVEVVEPVGSETYLELSVGGQSLTARVPAKGQYQDQQTIELVMNMDACHLFDVETESAVY